MNTLPAHLVQLKENDVIPYFTLEAIERSKLLKWDPIKAYFMTEDEIYYNDMDTWKDAEILGLDISAQQTTQSTTTRHTGSVAGYVANIEAQTTRVERIYTGSEACSIGTAQSRASGIRTKRLTGIMEDDSTIGSASTSKSSRKQKDDQWDQQLKVVTANQANTARSLEDMTLLLHKVLGLNKEKTVRVAEHSQEITLPSPAGSTDASGEGV